MTIAEAPSEFDQVDVGLLPKEIGSLYRQLAREDLPIQRNPQVAGGMPYITGETCRQVLNQVLGIHRWSFKVVSQELVGEADHIIVLGRLAVWITDPDTHELRLVEHEAFGGKQVIRSRDKGTPVNLGFDYKAAQTEALKKAATDIGVGLWLSRKESAFWDAQEAGDPPKPSGGTRPTTAPARTNGSSAAASTASASGSTPRPSTNGANNGAPTCDVCGETLKPETFRDGKTWSVEMLVNYGQARGHTVCYSHYRALKAKAENKPLPSGISLPDEASWAINNQAAAAAPAGRPSRPQADAAQAPPDPVKVLAALKTKLAEFAAESTTEGQADEDSAAWVADTLSSVPGIGGINALAFLKAVFGDYPPLQFSHVDAIEAWFNKDGVWQERLQTAMKAVSVQAAA